MVISALVVTLSPEAERRAAALAQLASDPRLTLGAAQRDRLPVVAESGSTADGVALVEALGDTPGVMRVDVVSIDFSLEDA